MLKSKPVDNAFSALRLCHSSCAQQTGLGDAKHTTDISCGDAYRSSTLFSSKLIFAAADAYWDFRLATYSRP